MGAVITQEVVSESAEVAPQAADSPTRQSGPESAFGFMAWRLGPIVSEYPFEDLRVYEPRWVWPPSFEHTGQYVRMRQSIKDSGIFHPLLILSDGRIVDGRHRYFCAKELRLGSVPARVIDVPLPLGDMDQLAIEEWAVYDTIARRQLTKSQATEMLYDLLRGRNEVQSRLVSLANLKRGKDKGDIRHDPSHPTVKELAARAGKSHRSVERAITVARHAPPEIQAQLRGGALTLGGAERAMKAALASANGAGEGAAAPASRQAAEPAPAPLPAEGASQFARVTVAFVDSARDLVRKARSWNREALEQLAGALGQIETSFRDAAARAHEGHCDD